MKSRFKRTNRIFRTLNIALLLGLATACGSDIGAPIGIAHAEEGIRIAAPAARIVEPKGPQVAVLARAIRIYFARRSEAGPSEE